MKYRQLQEYSTQQWRGSSPRRPLHREVHSDCDPRHLVCRLYRNFQTSSSTLFHLYTRTTHYTDRQDKYIYLTGIPVNLWSTTWWARFNETDPSILLSFEFSRLNLELRPSTIPGAGLGIFTTRQRGANALVGVFYGTLFYDDPSTGPSSQASVYGEGTMDVPVN